MRFWKRSQQDYPLLNRALGVLALLALAACNPLSETKIAAEWNSGVAISTTHSTLAVSNAQVASGNTTSVTISLRDANNMAYISSRPIISFSASGGTSTGTLGPVTNNGDGSYTANFTGFTAGTATTLRANINGQALQSSLPTVTVTSGSYSLSNSTIAVSAGSVVSGSSVTATLTVRDPSGNQLSSGGLTVAFSNSGGSSTGSHGTVTDNLDGTYSALFTGLVGGTATSINATIQGSAVTSSTPTVTVSGGSASAIAVSSGSGVSGVVGTTAPFVALVTDINGNPLQNATVNWAVTGGGGSVSSVSNLTTSSGLSSSTLTLGNFIGTNSVTATVQGTGLVATFTATGTHAAASQLVFATQPGGGTSALAWSTQPVVQIQDAYGNLVTTGVDATRTLTMALTTGTGALTGTLTENAVAGVADFSANALKLDLVGTNKVITASTTITAGAVSVASSTFAISVGAASRLAFGVSPTATTSNTSISPSITVIAQDSSGNTVTGYSAAIVLALANNPTSATLGGTLSQTPGAGTGASTFNNITINYPGTGYTLSATSGVLTAATSGAFNINSTAFPGNWPFDALSTSLYGFSASVIQFTGGIAELIGVDQVDSDNTATGFAGGSLTGLAFSSLGLSDGSSGLKLGNDGTCNGSTTNCAELSAAWTPQWASLVSYWKLNESSLSGATSEVVDSKGSNHGARTGSGVTAGSISQVGRGAATFSGNGHYINIPNTASLQDIQEGNFTLSGWFKPAQVPPGTGSANDAGYAIIGKSGNHLAVQYNNNQTFGFYSWSSTNVVRFAESTQTYIPGNYYHVVAVTDRTNGTVSIYVNGTLQGSATFTPNQAAREYGTNPFMIGIAGTSGGYSAYAKGVIDEVAIWGAALTAAEVKTIYDRQSPAITGVYGGTFTSRVMDALSSSSWTTLSWVPTLPFMKELPDAACAGATCTHTNYESANSTTGYASLSDNSLSNKLMDGIVGLWHLDEATGTTGAGSVKDDSGQGNHGSPSSATFGATGKLSGAVSLNNGSVDITGNTGLTFGTGSYTITAWVNPTSVSAYKVIFTKGESTAGSLRAFMRNDGALCLFWGVDAGGQYPCAGMSLIAGVWQHAVWGYNATTGKVFYALNGQYQESTSANNPITSTAAARIGKDSSGAYGFPGSIDEVAVWSRALSANEIKQLYQRGASRLKHQVRTCATNPCTTETWKGPDGTSSTYFSELNNNTAPLAMTGDVKATLPSMLFSSFTSPPSANQYFQYRTIFETDSTDIALGPELKSVTVDPVHYPTYLTTDTAPGNTIIGLNGVAFYDLSAFAQTLGTTNGCSSGVVYNIGLSNTGPWKYWTGAAWATSNGSSAQANTAATINTNAATFGSSVGRGSIYFKAFMQSSGTSRCELDNISVSGNR